MSYNHLSRGMHVFALTWNGELIKAVVKDVVECNVVHLFFPHTGGKKIPDTALSARWIAHPDEPIAIVRMLWRETEDKPLCFRIERVNYADLLTPAEKWPYGTMLFETDKNNLFFGPLNTPELCRPMLTLPTKPVTLELPRTPTTSYNEGLAFRKRNRNSFSRF